MKIEDLLAEMERDVEGWARKLLPGGKRIGREWDCRAGESPFGGSASVVLSGAKTGRVGFWQGRPDKPGQNGGDLLHLVMAVRSCTLPDAIEWVKGELGLSDSRETQAEKDERRRQAEERRKARSLQAARQAESKQERARRMWQTASPRLLGTVAETYLRGRGIDLASIPHLEAWLHLQPRLEWWMGAEYEQRDGARFKVRPGPTYPALVSAVVDVNGVQTAVHCTFLTPDGSGKAPVDPAKLMFGSVEASVIRLTKGATGLTPEEAKAEGVSGLLVLAEGVENGFSVAMADPEPRIWAATSLGNLAHAPVWHPCVSAVIVARDNDRGNDQAELAFERALEHLRSHGKPVAVMQAPARVDDVNDLLKGKLNHG